MSAAISMALSAVLALAAGCHDNTRLGTGNTGGSTTPSDIRQQIWTMRETPVVAVENPNAPGPIDATTSKDATTWPLQSGQGPGGGIVGNPQGPGEGLDAPVKPPSQNGTNQRGIGEGKDLGGQVPR
ncbi:MAG: hypothetical protein SFX73_05860 [Kofleriaceae bacterium]|nr:hypothetical protein [Kofleriaceae bacterium]